MGVRANESGIPMMNAGTRLYPCGGLVYWIDSPSSSVNQQVELGCLGRVVHRSVLKGRIGHTSATMVELQWFGEKAHGFIEIQGECLRL
jgi:hypothetical protein